MPGFYCDEAEDKTYRCEICEGSKSIDFIDGKYLCYYCANKEAIVQAKKFKKKQHAYETMVLLKIARENEKRAKGE